MKMISTTSTTAYTTPITAIFTTMALQDRKEVHPMLFSIIC